ncbi:MAG: integrase core domain-containing protein [Nitrospirota bacterium]|nr:integrase core domain-containing protein [Nitrospirota bacterium]
MPLSLVIAFPTLLILTNRFGAFLPLTACFLFYCASLRTNGSTERLNQTLLDEFYKVNFRKKVYTSLEEIQADLDRFLHRYNTQRTNQGKRCNGRTPMETFTEGLDLCRQYLHNGEEVIKEAA